MIRVLLLLGLIWPMLAQSSDLLREQQLSVALERNLRQGSAIKLQAEGREFLALHEEADSNAVKGGVILLHHGAGHADSLGVIHGLRVGLINHGWETLSLQLPLASEGAPEWESDQLIPKALPRIQAGLDYYTQRKLKQIVLIGHGLGGRMAARFVAEQPKPEIKGLILINMALRADQQADREALKKVKLPLLDLMGDRDLPALESARLRRETLRYGGNPDYRQDRIIGAGQDFIGREQMLLYRLAGWLSRYISDAGVIDYKAIGQ